MNILFLSRDYPPHGSGGVATYCYEMAKLLSKRRHNVFVIAHSKDNHSSEHIDDNGIHVFRVTSQQDITGSYLVDRLLYSYAVSKKLREVVAKYKIDIVEGREAFEEAFWYFFFHPRGRKPYLVVKLHTPESVIYQMNQCASNFDIRMVRNIEEWWIRRADKVIGLTKSMVELTSDFFRIRFNDIPIVPNPIDIEFFVPPENESIDEGITVLYTGRLEFRKGVHVLVRAIPRVLEKIPTAKFVFIGGDCGMKTMLMSMVKEYGCEKNVSFLGEMPREELKQYYQRATLCVVPSLWENHPYACLEALACGRPVVASDIGGIPEIIESNVSGILVPAGSSIQLAKAIIQMLNDSKLRQYLGENARKRMEKFYSPQNVAEQNLKIYESLLNRIK